MRRTFTGQQIVSANDGRFVGICLGYDFCAEHEWGIAGLKRAFGIPERATREKHGADARTATVCPPSNDLWFVRRGGFRYLMYWHHYEPWTPARRSTVDLNGVLQAYRDDNELVAAWDEKSFGLRMPVAGGEQKLTKLYQAIQDKDLMIFLGAPEPFGGRGLVLCIRSRVDAEILEAMGEADLDYIALREAAEATGIAARLDKAGKRYFALSPRWANEEKTDVVFWLNPMEQQRNNFGWFTVADLDDWIADRGKIPMTAKVG